MRLRIEGLFNEIQNVGKNVERLLAKTILGLCARIVAKMTSHLLKYMLRIKFGIDVISFSQINLQKLLVKKQTYDSFKGIKS